MAQEPRALRSALGIKHEDQADEDDALDDLEEIPDGRQPRHTHKLRNLKQASRPLDSEDANDEVEDDLGDEVSPSMAPACSPRSVKLAVNCM